MLSPEVRERLKTFIKANEANCDIRFEDSMFDGSTILNDDNIQKAVESEAYQVCIPESNLSNFDLYIRQFRSTVSFVKFIACIFKMFLYLKR